MGVFGKLAYEEGATVGTALSVRFTLAAALFWLLLAATRGIKLRGIGRRDLALALSLGLVFYAAQAGAYFAALDRIDASLVSVLVYTYPALVVVVSIALAREPVQPRRIVALACVTAGLVLVLAGAGTGEAEPLGAALALTCALVYTAYVLVGDGISSRVEPRLLSALVCTGAAFTLTLGSLASGDLDPGAVSAEGWGWLVCVAAISTVAAIGLFFAGLRLVGPSGTAILATTEPLVGVIVAAIVFGDDLSAAQLAGAAVVIAGVVVLQRGPVTYSSGSTPPA